MQGSGGDGLGDSAGSGGGGKGDGGILMRHSAGLEGGDWGDGELGRGGGSAGGGGGRVTVRPLMMMFRTVAPRKVTSISTSPQATCPLSRVTVVVKFILPSLV